MAVHTLTINVSDVEKYKNMLKNEECSFSIPQYTFFQAKAPLWQITFYKSGKVVIQGKNPEYILEKYFNQKTDNKTISKNGEIAPYPHIGIDESGKGDFFGPLVIAGCYLNEENAQKMKEKGAADSKKLDDKKILALSDVIKENSVFSVVVIGNKKYNEIYSKFKNLNRLLAWGHSTVLENILNEQECNIAISDKFADEKVILNALKEKGKNVNLIQQTKAESDTAVACASILARAEFVKRVSRMSYEYEIDFPKGAGENVIKCGEKFVSKYGFEELKNVSKSHFKTTENFQNHDDIKQRSLF